jgi:hypothetical protein
MTLEVAREVMREVEGGVPSFEPLVRYNACGIMGTDFSVIMHAGVHREISRHPRVRETPGRALPSGGHRGTYATAYGVHPDGSEPGGNS